jgi:hypothetical protein
MLLAGLCVLATRVAADQPSPVPLAPEGETPHMPQPAQGAWREHVQLVWNVFDPFAAASFDLFWEPHRIESDRPGRIGGSGVLTWRRAGSPRHGVEPIMAQYQGDMTDGRAHGHGTFVDRSGLRYDGDWIDGLMEGEGHLLLPNGDVYRGGFKAGRLHGQGLYIDAAGRVYDGGFSAGLRDGPAQVAEPDGQVYASVWTRGIEDQRRRGPAVESWAQQHRVEMRGPAGLAIPVGVGTGVLQFCCHGSPIAFGYAATSFADRLDIYPDAPRLLEVWRGRANVAVAEPDAFDLIRRQFEEYSFFNFNSKYIKTVPLQFGLENRGTRPAVVVGAYLDLVRSEVDLQPALQLLELNPFGIQNFSFSIENYGWSPARNARLTFRFQNATKSLRTDPIQIATGEISTVGRFSFGPALSQHGVRLQQLPRPGAACNSDRQEARPGCLARLVRSGVFGQLSDFVVIDGRKFGVRAVGQLNYDWTDADGRSQSVAAPFDALVPLGTFQSLAECEGADFREIAAGRPFQLPESSARQRVPFPLQETVAAGTIRRWQIMLDAKKSSRHDLRVVLVLADGQEVVSRNISLLLLRPRTYSAAIRPFGEVISSPSRC